MKLFTNAVTVAAIMLASISLHHQNAYAFAYGFQDDPIDREDQCKNDCQNQWKADQARCQRLIDRGAINLQGLINCIEGGANAAHACLKECREKYRELDDNMVAL